MDLKKLTDSVKNMVQKRGGVQSVKEDAGELRDIARSDHSMADKAREASAAIKEPGAEGDAAPPA
jgi:hypothetical protein